MSNAYDKRKNLKQAVLLGSLCTVTYFVVYVSRNILSAVTPQLLECGKSNRENIGAMSSLFFLTYAVGQLINGILGDKIRARYMVSGGLLLAGISNVLTAGVIENQLLAAGFYGVMGYGLSMIYAPMVRMIAESTELVYAEKCNLALSIASLFGAPVAGVIAGICRWKDAFSLVSLLLIVTSVCFFGLLRALPTDKMPEKKAEKRKKKANTGGVRILIQRNILLLTVVSALTGIVRTAVVFWMPTYISQYLGFSTENASLIFSVATIAISVSPILSTFIYEKIGRNMEKMLLLCFFISTAAFSMLFFVDHPVLNIILLSGAVLFSNSAASMIWVVYCPSLSDTGMVSTATGYLDFISYGAAAISNYAFSNAVSTIGWKKLILVWAALMMCGVVVTLFPNIKKSWKCR